MSDKPSNRSRAFALLLVAFVAGGLLGAAGDRAYVVSSLQRQNALAGSVARGSDSVVVDQIPLPLQRLGLASDETAQLHNIARRWRPQAGDALNDMRHRVTVMENGMFAEMLCVLPQDKRERYRASIESNPALLAARFALVDDHRCPDSTASIHDR